jgi:MarR family transcriptional regulator, organic hydroperoxide resistance regulator
LTLLLFEALFFLTGQIYSDIFDYIDIIDINTFCKEKLMMPSSNDALASEIVELLRELLHALLASTVPTWLDLQLTVPQLRTVFVIAHEKISSVTAVSQNLGIGEPTASHLIDKLVRAGLVKRTEDPGDRRRALVQLTPAGEELIAKLLGWEDLLGGCLQKIPEDDLSHFRVGLCAIVAELRTHPSAARQTP